MIKINGSNVTIMVKDINKSIQFYENLGLTLKQRWDDHYAMVQTKDIMIGLHPDEGKNQSSGTISIGFFIDDINEAIALLKKLNIESSNEDGESGNYLHFKDPDGTTLYYVQPKWS